MESDEIETDLPSIATPQPRARDSATRRLCDLLRASIIDAALSGDDARLPDERELMTQFDVPRDMVRDALALLADEGTLMRRPGVGTISTTEVSPLDLVLPPSGFTLRSFLHSPAISPRVLSWHWTAATPIIAMRLDGVEVGDDILCIDYLVLVNARPVASITNYLRAAEGQVLQPTDFVDDFYTLLDREEIGMGSHDFLLQASLADRLVSELLEVRVGDAVQRFEQVIRNVAGEVIDFATGVFRREIRMQARGVLRSEAVPGDAPDHRAAAPRSDLAPGSERL